LNYDGTLKSPISAAKSKSSKFKLRKSYAGYAGAFNRLHRRHGRLFQNRYKSILCREDTCPARIDPL